MYTTVASITRCGQELSRKCGIYCEMHSGWNQTAWAGSRLWWTLDWFFTTPCYWCYTVNWKWMPMRNAFFVMIEAPYQLLLLVILWIRLHFWECITHLGNSRKSQCWMLQCHMLMSHGTYRKVSWKETAWVQQIRKRGTVFLGGYKQMERTRKI